MDCGHYVSDVFDANTGIWWHYDDNNITEISDLPEGVYNRESHQNKKTKKIMSDSDTILLVVYIITSHLIAYIYIIDKQLSNM